MTVIDMAEYIDEIGYRKMRTISIPCEALRLHVSTKVNEFFIHKWRYNCYN